MYRKCASTVGVLVALAAGACIADGGSPDGERPSWTASVDLRIGAVEGPGPVFGPRHTLHDMAPTPGGGVLVIDGQEMHVAEFDTHGDFVRRFGRGGSGPGEFRTPAFVGMLGDTVWVSDEALRRVSYFTRDGELIRTVTLNRSDVEPPYRLLPPVGPVGEGRWLTRVSMGTSAMVDAGVERLPMVTVDASGRVRDTLALRRISNTAFVARSLEGAGGMLVTRQPFENATGWAIRPDGTGIFTVEQADDEQVFVVSHIAPTGDTVWSRGYPYDPVELSEDQLQPEKADLIELVLSSRALGVGTDAAAEQIVDGALYAPEFLPTVTGFVMASGTEFYVRREEPAPDRPQRWTFFSDREPVADVFVPHDIEVHAAAGDVLWGVATDELDLAYVVRLRVGE